MGEDEFKKKDAGPDEQRDDTEGHKKWETGTGSASEPGGGPDEAARRTVSAIPDTDDDTEGHHK